MLTVKLDIRETSGPQTPGVQININNTKGQSGL